MTDIANRVRQIIFDHFSKVRNLDISRIVPDAHLIEDLDADDLDLIEIVFSLEEQFDREISEDDRPNSERLVTSPP